MSLSTPLHPLAWTEIISAENNKAFREGLKERFQKTSFYTETPASLDSFDAPMGDLASGDFALWIPGVALLAARLMEKKELTNLYVAKTMEAFMAALKTQVCTQEIFRAAYIISPSFSGCPVPKNFPQHKLAVVIEKTTTRLKTAILDPMPVGNQANFNPDHLDIDNSTDIWSGFEAKGNFNALELISRAVVKSCANSDIFIESYYSKVIRQTAHGCAIFAIYDAIAYLKNPLFFQQIECEAEILEVKSKTFSMQGIIALPPAHMRATQSLTTLQTYKDKYTKLYPLPVSHKSQKSLEEALKETVVSFNEDKIQNHYITKKEFKLFNWIVDILQNRPDEAKRMIEKVLLSM